MSEKEKKRNGALGESLTGIIRLRQGLHIRKSRADSGEETGGVKRRIASSIRRKIWSIRNQ